MTTILSPLSKQLRIGVLCGGMSSEREVSLRSGKNCAEALKRLGYTQVTLIDVDRQIAHVLQTERIEVAFLTLHGQYGEDGCIQGLLEILGIPYTGNRVAASALTMDKDLTKRLLVQAGLPVLPSQVINLACYSSPSEATTAYTGDYPVMVKPLAEGSSVGMTKVNTAEALPAALNEAGRYSPRVMLERFLPGRSITVGVIDRAGQPSVTPILELRTQTEWYDLAAKYTEGLTEFVLPAELSPEVTAAIQATTLQAHQVLGCHGLSRTDFVVDAANRFYILETNTIPGMTNLSDLPAQAEAMGIGYDELVELILQTAFTAPLIQGALPHAASASC